MSRKSHKHTKKVEAIQAMGQVNGVPLDAKAARLIAKKSKFVRLRRKQALLCIPGNGIVSTVTVGNEVVEFSFPQGVEIQQDGNTIRFAVPQPAKKPKKEKKAPEPVAAPEPVPQPVPAP